MSVAYVYGGLDRTPVNWTRKATVTTLDRTGTKAAQRVSTGPGQYPPAAHRSRTEFL